MSQALSKTYFENPDVVALAKDLIGKRLNTFSDGVLTAGIITETEAYAGKGDKACHAHLGRFTKRTQVMYESGGIAYVYLCYGIHHLFNIVTNTNGNADAILIRAIEPTQGLQKMLERRNKQKLEKSLTSGPGNVTKALGITKSHNTKSVLGQDIWIDNPGIKIESIVETTRIGIDYAEEDANLPWRFYKQDSKYISVK
ncbi:DNA-3-methyladenine glycosylase [Psychroflexus gondwanensis]|jgi:DNA-3-methyladenine glycosylase|uniref:Putative 3-methyladenine DNA glycosylase n=1 Tax=Psychroflexus gondwanensis ACAM 44 TaxID=1189619 RepID=N1WUC4_9FLAO|nr:DNA-3-methyladenine glycosylase [Psychroflexus gondwanensis]EMY82620.1 DNA-3-methyladenine glycosylase II Mpg [Psychroflexus gondwanensis ACAM 44]TXE21176.1 DNA-3-methyladenine glycosylase [Psychroflexus gondwanensis]